MADYFTNFSLIVPLPSEAAQEYALNLAEQAKQGYNGEEIPADFPPSLREVTEDWHFDAQASGEPECWGVWLHSTYGGVDAASAFIQHLLQQFNPDGHVALEWSNDYSKPRTDAFGGGAAIITAKKIRSITTGEWLQRMTAKLETHNNRQR